MNGILSGRGRTAAVLCLLALAGCGEDMGPITASWTKLQGAMGVEAEGLRKQFNEFVATAKALPPVAATDSVGQALLGKLNSAMAGELSQLNELDDSAKAAAASVQEALKTEKVANVQKAMDDARKAYDAIAAKVGASRTAITGLLAEVKAHTAQLAAEAARIGTVGATTDFTDIDFKAGKADFLFDRPHTQETLDKLLAFVNSCPDLTVDIVGHTSNEGTAAANQKLSLDRATAVKKWLLSKGVAANKIHSVSGVGATVNVVPEPAANSPEAKAMPAAALEELRRKNRRITVSVVTPCPAAH